MGRVDMVRFFGILAVILFFCGFALCHGSGWCIVVGLACLVGAGLIGAKLSQKDEEEADPYI